MVLYGKTGDVIEKSIKAINNNSFPVIVELEPSGNLTKDIKIIDNNFTLEANSEKNANFLIRITKEGRSDGSIVVRFTPKNIEDGKNGIALPASIVIFAEKGNGTLPDWDEWNKPGDKPPNNPDNSGNNSELKISPLIIGLIITVVVFIIFFVLLMLYYKKNVKKEGKLNEKKKTK